MMLFRLAPLLGKLSDSAFSASSSQVDSEPWQAKMKSGGVGTSWQPVNNEHGEYLQVDLGMLEPVYGVSTAGGVNHVTSYELLYSVNNVTYSYISLLNFPEVCYITNKSVLPLVNVCLYRKY